MHLTLIKSPGKTSSGLYKLTFFIVFCYPLQSSKTPTLHRRSSRSLTTRRRTRPASRTTSTWTVWASAWAAAACSSPFRRAISPKRNTCTINSPSSVRSWWVQFCFVWYSLKSFRGEHGSLSICVKKLKKYLETTISVSNQPVPFSSIV